MTLKAARNAMATDWIATLKEQARLAQRFAKEVPTAIARPDLTLDQASRIYGMVEKGSQDFNRIVEDMNGQNLDDALYVAAGRLKDIWSELLASTAHKVQALEDMNLRECEPR